MLFLFLNLSPNFDFGTILVVRPLQLHLLVWLVVSEVFGNRNILIQVIDHLGSLADWTQLEGCPNCFLSFKQFLLLDEIVIQPWLCYKFGYLEFNIFL